MLTVQYFNNRIQGMNMEDFRNIPLRGPNIKGYTPLQSVADIHQINTPTEVDHYQIRRVIDIYVATKTEALEKVGGKINNLLAHTETDKNTRLNLRGGVVSMNDSFQRFGLGLLISIALVYLILMAQFTSFVDPFIILMAIPPGLAGVVMILLFTGSTLNIMSLMGVIMMTGIVVSNSILIVEFSGILHNQGMPLVEATGAGLQGSPAPDSDDFARHAAGHDPDGTRHRSGQRTVCSAGSRHYRRPRGVCRGHRLSRARCLAGDPFTP